MLKLFLLNPDSPSHRVKLVFDLVLADRAYRLVRHLGKQVLKLGNFLWVIHIFFVLDRRSHIFGQR